MSLSPWPRKVVPLLDLRMSDGSRQFAKLPQAIPFQQLRDHLASLPGAHITEFLTDDVTEAWIDFDYAGHRFTVNNQFGDCWFFVQDPACPDSVMRAVVAHAVRRLW